MAAKNKKQPKYMQKAEKPDNEDRKDGNETRELNHVVWMIDGGNELIMDEYGNP